MARTWLNANTMYEDFPIYFRRPDVRVAEFDALQPAYPRLLVVTHMLAQVKSNGLPESDYNDSLLPLDQMLTVPFREPSNGLIAVIETFAGKRTYYIYLTPSFDADAFVDAVRRGFPHETLEHEVEDDPDWRLFRGYAKDFQFP